MREFRSAQKIMIFFLATGPLGLNPDVALAEPPSPLELENSSGSAENSSRAEGLTGMLSSGLGIGVGRLQINNTTGESQIRTRETATYLWEVLRYRYSDHAFVNFFIEDHSGRLGSSEEFRLINIGFGAGRYFPVDAVTFIDSSALWGIALNYADLRQSSRNQEVLANRNSSPGYAYTSGVDTTTKNSGGGVSIFTNYEVKPSEAFKAFAGTSFSALYLPRSKTISSACDTLRNSGFYPRGGECEKHPKIVLALSVRLGLIYEY